MRLRRQAHAHSGNAMEILGSLQYGILREPDTVASGGEVNLAFAKGHISASSLRLPNHTLPYAIVTVTLPKPGAFLCCC